MILFSGVWRQGWKPCSFKTKAHGKTFVKLFDASWTRSHQSPIGKFDLWEDRKFVSHLEVYLRRFGFGHAVGAWIGRA